MVRERSGRTDKQAGNHSMSWLWTTSEGRAKLRRAGVSTRAQRLLGEGLNSGEVVAGGTPRAADYRD